jgi:uncharacterized protein YqgC (DUF456 family)
MKSMHITLVVIFSLLILATGASFLLMVFPAHLFLLIISLVFGLVDHFQHLKLWEWGILAGLVVVMVAADWLSGLWGAKVSGASRKSIIWGIVGMIIGLIIFPPFGSLIGLFLGILVSELVHFTEYKKAIKAASGSVLGTLAGTLINLVLSILFLILFIVFALH